MVSRIKEYYASFGTERKKKLNKDIERYCDLHNLKYPENVPEFLYKQRIFYMLWL